MKKILFIVSALMAGTILAEAGLTADGMVYTNNLGKVRSKEQVVTGIGPSVLGRGANTFTDPDDDGDYWNNAGPGLFSVKVQHIYNEDTGVESAKIPALNRDGTVQTTESGRTNYVGSAYLLDQDGIEYLSIHGGTTKTAYSYHRNGNDWNIGNMPYIYGSNTGATNNDETAVGNARLQGIPCVFPPRGSDGMIYYEPNKTSYGNVPILVDREWLVKLLVNLGHSEATVTNAINAIVR